MKIRLRALCGEIFDMDVDEGDIIDLKTLSMLGTKGSERNKENSGDLCLPKGDLRIKVKRMTGQTYMCTLKASSTVQDLKDRICSMLDIPCSIQMLIFNGITLHPSQYLHKLNIRSGDTVHLMCQMKNGALY
jgi:hypothetical protein